MTKADETANLLRRSVDGTLVAIGAAEGSVDSLKEMLAAVDVQCHETFLVVISGGDTTVPWDVAGMQAVCPIPVALIDGETLVRPGTVYLSPPGCPLRLQSLRSVDPVTLGDRGDDDCVAFVPGDPCDDPINQSFDAVQCMWKGPLVGVLLSGRGNDGVDALAHWSDAGHTTMVESPKSAAIADKVERVLDRFRPDEVIAAKEVPSAVCRPATHSLPDTDAEDGESTDGLSAVVARDIRQVIDDLCEVLRKQTDHDFRHYKQSTVMRRIARRMQVRKVANAEAYLDLVQSDRDETDHLFRELLVNVTSFFRDPDAFDVLRDEVSPALVESLNDNTLRVWVPGCASGQEAYSIAIVLAEHRRLHQLDFEIQIFATDIDRKSLALARQGHYPLSIASEVPGPLLQRYFTKKSDHYEVNKLLRDLCVFTYHDLIADPPFSRIDLISCRNVLIYFGPHLQQKVIPLFHFALRPKGFLLLGTSESLGNHQDLFRVVDQRQRISQRRPASADPMPRFISHSPSSNAISDNNHQPASDSDIDRFAQRIIIDEFSPRWIVINGDGQMVAGSSKLDPYLEIPSGPFRNDAIKLVRTGLRNGLRTAFREASERKDKVVRQDLRIRQTDGIRAVRLTVQPMPSPGDDDHLYMVVFEDMGPLISGHPSHKDDSHALVEQLEQEVDRTRSELELTVQQLESSNEDLTASNEELRSLNEEMQAANEELEASKEEVETTLQQLATAKNDLQALLASSQIAAIFLDGDFVIRSYTEAARMIYDLLPSDVGRSLLGFRAKVQQMPDIPDVGSLVGKPPTDDLIEADNGRWFVRRVLLHESAAAGKPGIVVTFHDVSELHERQRELRERENQLRTITDAIPPMIILVDTDERYRFVNKAYANQFGRDRQAIIGQKVIDVVGPENYETVRPHLLRGLAGETHTVDLQFSGHRFTSDNYYQVNYVPQRDSSGVVDGCHVIVTDITERKRNETALAEGQRKLDLALQAGHLGAWEWDIASDRVTWSRSLYDTLRYRDNEFDETLNGFIDLIHPSDRAMAREQIEAALSGAAEQYEVEIRMLRGDGRYVWVFGQAVVMRDGEGNPRAMMGVAADISSRKQRELDLAFQASLQLEFTRLQDPAELMRATTARLADYLGLSRCLLTEVDPDALVSTVIHDHQTHPAEFDESAVGQYRISDFHTPDECDRLRHGEQVVLNDVRDGDRDPRLVEHFESLDIRSLVDSSYVDSNGLKFVIAAIKQTPHQWTANETSLLQETCNRLCLRLERAHAEAQLIDREAHLRRVINNQLGLVGVIDSQGVLLEVDDRSLAIAGLQRDDVIGKAFASSPWWNYDPNVAEKIEFAVQQALSGQTVRFDIGLFHHSGEPLMIDFMLAPVRNAAGDVEFVIPSGVDISARYRAEQVLREANAKLRVLFDQSYFFTGIVSTDGMLTDINDATLTRYGFGKDEIVGKRLWNLPWWSQQVEVHRLLRQEFHSVLGGQTFHQEFRLFDRSGRPHYIDLVLTPALDEEGEVLFVVLNGSDVTERHEYETSLHDARRMAEQANAAKSEFIANMSHEIRTPMTAILGYADLARQQSDSDELDELLGTIVRNGNFLLDIINDILDLSKIEAGKMEVSREKFSVVHLIEDVRSIMNVRAKEKGLSLDVRYDGKVPEKIESDPRRLKQVLINLVGNAIKFTQEGGVEIAVSHDESGEDLLQIEIEDSGIGMSDEQLQKLFRPFTQGDASVNRQFGGTGLGLTISRRLAGILGGTIKVDSEIEKGSTFVCTVAIGDVDDVPWIDGRDVAQQAVLEEKDDAPPELDCYVLVVDDRRDIRYLSRRLLTRCGATVREAEDGQEAVELVESLMEQGPLPDLILLDMQMPRLDGYQTARRLREMGFDRPIIALTADAMQGDMRKSLQFGCDDYLSKPIDAQALLRTVAKFTGPRSQDDDAECDST
ncbi:CheR family methyltransferase [Crateriforma conspicua]|uniref:Virulence sensor protein BvgS n=1 Tax=Crateriforma conspicua TaxID=2527996 RepID=A0A5C5Y279_9PLAN|nr:CheR family methyltransferase [Crateriforma conspicua]TWT68919.1 Virulence sensor protein BvgS precursor [Crateriforma conspicua]